MAALLLLAVMPVLLVYNAFALMLMWGWFVTPTFGVPVPTIPVLIGLAAIVSLMTRQRMPDDDKSPAYLAVYSLLTTTLYILIGYVVSLFR